MIVIVKVNQLHKHGADPKKAAYRAWRLARLIKDEHFRNKYKFLVAYVRPNVVGTFCIKGIAWDHEYPNKVKFELEETSSACDLILTRIINDLYSSNPAVINAQERHYIDSKLLDENDIEYGDIKCDCVLGNIPLYEVDEIGGPE